MELRHTFTVPAPIDQAWSTLLGVNLHGVRRLEDKIQAEGKKLSRLDVEGWDEMTRLIQGIARAGYGLLTVYSLVSGQALFEYDYVLRFGGSGRLSAVQDELSNFKTARLVGAFEART